MKATTTAGGPGDRPGKRGVATRAALVRATAELVAEVGYHQATTRAIAERAGVAEGSIYRHFPDKRALFSAAVVEGQQGLTEWMTDLPQRAGTAPLEQVLTEALAQLSRLRAAIIPLEAALAASPELGGDFGGARPGARHPLTPGELAAGLAERGGPPLMLARYLAAEQELGHVQPDLDPAHTAVVLLATLYGVQTSPLAGPDGMDVDAIHAVVRLFVRGIGSGPAADRVARD
ncbi:MAG TPA: TetR/AcrR family transcriptional regulator [Mycobacteriales bacterium]